jgi:hypothetical protein
MASFIRIGGDKWNIPPRVNNRFSVRTNFGDGATLFDVRDRAWLSLDSEGFVDVTPGNSYLLYKLTQQEIIDKSTHYSEVHKRKTKGAKRKPSLFQLTRGIYFSQMAKEAKQQGHPIGFKELAESWKTLSKEELEKYQKLAVIKMEEQQIEQEHAPTSAVSSSSSVYHAPTTGEDTSTKPPKAKKHKSEKAVTVAATTVATESKSIIDMLDPKKKKSSTPKLAPNTTSTPAAAAIPSNSQKPKEKHGKGEAKSASQPIPSQPQKPIAAKAPPLSQPAPMSEIRNEFASDSEEEDEESEEEMEY